MDDKGDTRERTGFRDKRESMMWERSGVDALHGSGLMRILE